MQIDNKSFRTLYELHYKALYKFLHFYTNNTCQIEDVIQDIFIKLWEDKTGIEICYIKTYLFHSARNNMLNQLRNQNQRLNLLENWFDEQELQTNNSDCYDSDAFYSKAQQAVDNLPPKCKEMFLLSRKESMTYNQIAIFKNVSIKPLKIKWALPSKKSENI